MASENDVTMSAVDDAGNQLGPNTVDIWTTKLDYSVDKTLVVIPVPKASDGNYSYQNTDNKTWIVDLGRTKEVITISGFLIDESSSSAKQKRDILKALCTDFKKIKITWGGDSSGGTNRKLTYYGNIEKLMISETAGIIADNSQPSGYEQEKTYAVQLSFTVGTNKMK